MDYTKGTILCFIVLPVCLFCTKLYGQKKNWTWMYTQEFDKKQMVQNGQKKCLIFEKNTTPKFSQLIFSWNAFRPSKGFFVFYVQSRNAQTKKWSQWHKMISWGGDIQRSHCNTCDLAKYIYVRLESGRASLANAFRIKIEAHNGTSLGILKSFGVTISDFTRFTNEYIGKKIISLKSVHIKRVPKISQRCLNHPKPLQLCSPTACSMLAGFLSKKYIDPVDFAYSVFDHGGLKTYGSWPFNTVQIFDACDGKVVCYVSRLNSFLQLHQILLRNVPVVVSVRGYIKGAPKRYKAGHLLIVVGWDARRKKVICHDPAFFSDEGTFVRYDIDSFIRAWERSNRLAYVASVVT